MVLVPRLFEQFLFAPFKPFWYPHSSRWVRRQGLRQLQETSLEIDECVDGDQTPDDLAFARRLHSRGLSIMSAAFDTCSLMTSTYIPCLYVEKSPDQL